MLGAIMLMLSVTIARAATPAQAGVFVPHALIAHLQSHATTLLADGTVLITGGLDNSSTAQNTAAVYNPATGVTTILGVTMSVPRYDHTATLLSDGRVLIAGGNTTGGTPVSSAELYSPSTTTFTPLGSPMTVARAPFGMTTLTSTTTESRKEPENH
jgi:hypothetical protein